MPVLPPYIYDNIFEWLGNKTLKDWLLPRIVELTYTSWDMLPFAKDCGYTGIPFRWDEERRFLVRCELDAVYFHLYGIERDDVEYIMDTFPIVRRKDEAKYGTFRTKEMIFDIYNKMKQAMDMGVTYQTVLNLPNGLPFRKS